MMKGVFNPLTGYHNRRSIRLMGYDYSRSGAYFITMNVHPHAQLVFGEILAGATGASPKTDDPAGMPRMELNAFGKIVREEWERSFEIRHELHMGEYQIMPDHFHAIVIIRDQDKTGRNKETEEKKIYKEFDEGDAPVARTGFVQQITEKSNLNSNLNDSGSVASPIHNRPKGVRPRSIGALISAFKASSIKRINAARNMPGKRVWQRDYYDRIIRDERALYFTRRYIRNNPLNWFFDRESNLIEKHTPSPVV
jgi:putative transposase